MVSVSFLSELLSEEVLISLLEILLYDESSFDSDSLKVEVFYAV